MWTESDTAGLDFIDSFDINALDNINDEQPTPDDQGSLSPAAPKPEWHTNDTVLNHALAILQSRCPSDGVRVFPSNPDYDTLLHYYHDNRDPFRALYVVNASGTGFSEISPQISAQRRTNHWGSSKSNQPRFHLVSGRWVTNAKLPPPGTTASLLCRGGDYSKSLARESFERRLKPWRCAATRTSARTDRAGPRQTKAAGGCGHPCERSAGEPTT